MWEDFIVKIVYPRKLLCEEYQLKDDFRNAWPVINRLWLKNCNLTTTGKLPNQLDVWKEFIDNHAIEFPLFVKFLQIMIATSPNTSPLERGYSQLQMITEKRFTRWKHSSFLLL